MHMLCRNRVADYEAWRTVFDAHCDAHRAAGLDLLGMWRDASDPNDVVFLFQVEDEARARAFVEDPAAAEAGRISGVIEGEIRWLEAVDAD